MELQLTIFIGLVFLVLAWNAALLWVLRLQLKRAADRAARLEAGLAALIDALRAGTVHLEAESEKAIEWSAAARDRVHGLEADLDRADNRFRYGLATIDFKVDKAAERLQGETRRVKDAVWEPMFQTATLLQGAKIVLEILSARQRRRSGPAGEPHARADGSRRSSQRE